MSITTDPLHPKRVLSVTMSMFLVGLLLIVCALTVYLLYAQKSTEEARVRNQLAYLFIKVVEDSNRPLVVEPLSNKSYIPDAKLVLPSTDDTTGAVVYHYFASQNGVSADLFLASLNDIYGAEAPLLNSVNNTQLDRARLSLDACGRAVHITFAKTPDQKVVFTKLLSNGKMVYFSTEPRCSNQNLLSYAEKINSY